MMQHAVSKSTKRSNPDLVTSTSMQTQTDKIGEFKMAVVQSMALLAWSASASKNRSSPDLAKTTQTLKASNDKGS